MYRVCIEERSDKLMGEGIYKYAIPMKPPYEFPFACAVMYECRWKGGGKNMHKSCPRFRIGENMERNGQELGGCGRTAMILKKSNSRNPNNILGVTLGVTEESHTNGESEKQCNSCNSYF